MSLRVSTFGSKHNAVVPRDYAGEGGVVPVVYVRNRFLKENRSARKVLCFAANGPRTVMSCYGAGPGNNACAAVRRHGRQRNRDHML